MLKELLKRLQKRELTEQQEQELLNQMQEAANLIEENAKQRAIEKAKSEEINKDEHKLKKLQEISNKVNIVKQKNKRLVNIWTILATITTVIAVVGSMTTATLCAVNNLLVLAILLPILCVVVPVGFLYPVSKIFSKKSCKNDNEIVELAKEKEAIMDEVKIDIEKVIIDNLKLTNLPNLTDKTERVSEQVITKETINTI